MDVGAWGGWHRGGVGGWEEQGSPETVSLQAPGNGTVQRTKREPLGITGSLPVAHQRRAEPAGGGAVPPVHPGGLCLELLPGNSLARVRETFLGQRGNYLARSSV